jgi:hypothetical protein
MDFIRTTVIHDRQIALMRETLIMSVCVKIKRQDSFAMVGLSNTLE